MKGHFGLRDSDDDDDRGRLLTLKQVLFVHRHGQRTPVRDTLSGYVSPAAWDQCSLAPFLRALHTVLEPDGPPPVSPAVAPPNISEIRIIQGDQIDQPLFSPRTSAQLAAHRVGTSRCEPGHLTDIGKMHMLSIGAALRAHYVDAVKFLPQHLTSDYLSSQQLYVRSTGYLRTIESTQYLLSGLFPLHTREPGDGAVDIPIHIRAIENAFPKTSDCPKLERLLHEFSSARGAERRDRLKAVGERLETLFPAGTGEPGGDNTRSLHKGSDSHVFADVVNVVDAATCLRASGLSLPKGLTDNDVAELDALFQAMWWDAFQPDQREIVKLSIGNFIHDLITVMKSGVAGAANSPKFAVFSGHDTTVAPLLGALGHREKTYPGFGANLALEVFEDSSKTPSWWKRPDHYVRVKYNGIPIVVPSCAKPGAHFLGDPKMCTLSAFLATMEESIPKNFKKECVS
ncbi:histidine phosphatase superfamily [Zopfochytrium polystomum]|nr:histidine phosphatase superfamily [Zopfochytrium polystomum]